MRDCPRAVDARTGGKTVTKKQSKTALLFSQRTITHSPGRYTIAAHVPTGRGNETRSVKYHVHSAGYRRWVAMNEDDVVLETLMTKRAACDWVDRKLARMVEVAELVAEELPPRMPIKQRYAFDRSVASAVLLELSPLFRSLSMREGEDMVSRFLEEWYLDSSLDMTHFAHRWLVRQPVGES